jgi:hypothetical protein
MHPYSNLLIFTFFFGTKSMQFCYSYELKKRHTNGKTKNIYKNMQGIDIYWTL